MKKLTKGAICIALSLGLLSACKKEEGLTDQTISNKISAVNNQASIGTRESGNGTKSAFFAYLQTLPYTDAVDTLRKFIALKKRSELTGTKNPDYLSANKAVTALVDPSDLSSDQMVESYPVPQTRDLYFDVPSFVFEGYAIQVPLEWTVVEHYFHLWKVVSSESAEVTYQSINGGITFFGGYFSGFSHVGSRIVSTGVNPVSWSENLNEHFPMSFGYHFTMASSHVGGVLSFVVQLQKENWAIFNAVQ